MDWTVMEYGANPGKFENTSRSEQLLDEAFSWSCQGVMV